MIHYQGADFSDKYSIIYSFKSKDMITFIGIDISKAVLDIVVKNPKGIYSHFCIKNERKNIEKWFNDQVDSSFVIAMENTGRYNIALLDYLSQFNHQVYLLNPMTLKNTAGFLRGKNDKLDARRICEHIEKYQGYYTIWKPEPIIIQDLKLLYTKRKSLIKRKVVLKTELKEIHLLDGSDAYRTLEQTTKDELNNINDLINIIEQEILSRIQQDQELNKQFEILCSIPGIGKVTAWTLIIKTQGFTKFDNPRKFACYAGVVPFANSSGIYKGKAKLSCFADKQVKKVLHMAALSAIQCENQLREYYLRKVNEGKNKMSVINAVRNKIIHISFALIKNQNKYVNYLNIP